MRYAAKKLASLILTMLIVTLMTFIAFSLISGDPASTMLGTNAEADEIEALRDELGLNKPLHVRYIDWVRGFFTGDLGSSYRYRSQSVVELISPKLQVTLILSVMSFLMIIIVSLPLGLVAAGAKSRFYRRFRSALNRLCIALPRIAMTVNMLSSTVEAELRKDYARTVRSRGARESKLLFGHILKNSLPPIITFLGQTAAEIIAASVIVEQVFMVPGLGRFLISSISNRDYPVVEAIVVIIALWVVASSTAADLINLGVDPRLRRGAGE